MNLTASTTRSRLQQEHSRLFLVTKHDGECLVDEKGLVRAVVMEVTVPMGWRALSGVWYGVQSDFGLPAPAIAVSGTDGIQLWFSFANALDAAVAESFLTALKLRYLHSVGPGQLRTFPTNDGFAASKQIHTELVPADRDGSGHWSAFISADLAAIFDVEPWLDVPPNVDQQADILSKLQSIKPAQLLTILALREGETEREDQKTPRTIGNAGGSSENKNSNMSHQVASMSPQDFLLQVMQDISLPLRYRMEAAKALLPYIR